MFINIYVYMHTCVDMGRLQVVLSDDTEERLRKRAAEKFGLKKGSISQAVEEAITSWLKSK